MVLPPPGSPFFQAYAISVGLISAKHIYIRFLHFTG
ncbi:hypothetical protein EPIR_2569 [Erwinia piriflorinigrans CFBP 5888]|uniref:Uncharacterized protein n=1 Tax=Erwinia piriflorinigrans CFBP 5888 TaxID=1161919 RepID=V5Z973_9GAMM|nr:hypothetical protein EPIR_2569 [Erwinia piriflorinigrans CFBP 5888]